MEKFDFQQHRDDLARQIMDSPVDERRKVLDNARQTEEYWQARSERMKLDYEVVDDGMGILVKHKNFFHSSRYQNQKSFVIPEDGSFSTGLGIYLTSRAEKAMGYAGNRSGEKEEPTLYEVSISNLKFLNLLTKEGIKSVTDALVKMAEKNLKN